MGADHNVDRAVGRSAQGQLLIFRRLKTAQHGDFDWERCETVGKIFEMLLGQ